MVRLVVHFDHKLLFFWGWRLFFVSDRNFIRTIDATGKGDRTASTDGSVTVVFLANLPAPGLYYWDIFVDSEWTSESMDNACSVLIRCTNVTSSVSAQLSFPQVRKRRVGGGKEGRVGGREGWTEGDRYCILFKKGTNTLWGGTMLCFIECVTHS